MTGEERRVLITTSLPVLRVGSEGEPVTRLQALLNVASGAGLVEDGAFGPLTEAAVTDFQVTRHLLVDGFVGPQTWTALLWVPGRFPEVIVHQPQPFDIVDDPILIAGIGRAFEGTIATRALDADGNTLAQSFVQGRAGALGTFQGQLALGAVPATSHGTLEIGPAPVSDEGPPPEKTSIPIVFGRVLDETYFGFHPHTVVPGDTLSGLAEAFYGDASLFSRIFDANRNVVSDPDVLVADQILRIPVGEGTRFPPGG
ncbi:MAG: Gmad2 immunoglobulin-like domain-containing protein [Acidimicrobiales bacterium]